MGFSVEPGLWRPDDKNSTCQSEPSCVWYPTAHFPVINDEAEVRLVQSKPGQGVPQCWASPCNCGPTNSGRFGSRKSSYVQVGRLGFSRLGMKEHIYQGPSRGCLPFCNYSGSMPDSFLYLISRHKSAFGSPEPGWLIEFCSLYSLGPPQMLLSDLFSRAPLTSQSLWLITYRIGTNYNTFLMGWG